MKKIKIGETFTLKDRPGYIYTRLPDNQKTAFECERMMMKVVYPPQLKYPPSIFPVEPMWFTQRGLSHA